MPLLKRLLRAEELGDAPANATAEQLFASSVYSQEMRAQRQQAAALCSAPLVAVSTLATRRSGTSSALGNALERTQSCSVEVLQGCRCDALRDVVLLTDCNDIRLWQQCVLAALLVAREGKQVLFLVRDPKGVTKRLAAAVSSPDAAMTTELAAECLHRVHFRKCRGVYELLCELDRVQQSWQDTQDGAGLQLVALGPLCALFAGFQTASGITTTGAGLKRMVELAIKRLRATTSIHVSVMEVEAS
ncbi:hypothetical protein PHYPSEUDO_015587 [Phytophthora pseudosyringae]|uniref:Uncharacterized protein n=1 Tax=Phytophthora pseudosyringae TaxID=221518 RepID=A0A8T1VYL0_9STRA|nr:hypothetical protein PHYPSEUDO_015587 [Phytophthora pseudosyringae]